jgi:HD superfamily phosphohydrolase
LKKLKIFNDPVYGFISVPDGLIMELIEHTVFQRLRRIKQLGLSDFIYPGATHSRFHHALGAFHLMTEALDSLRLKGVSISEEEYEASQIAILLHDIGHGPFSHVLEHSLLPVAHEEITILLMEWLNVEFKGRLSLALRIFKNQYSRSFFHDLISSQLDVDRLDYLTRDSFFTGVAEGVIGYDRLIKMMDVHEDHIVLEEKGLYSIEKFLVARRIMYWQVYMHKTAIAAEKMLHSIFELVKSDLNKYIKNSPLIYFIDNEYHNQVDIHSPDFIDKFLSIDDSDIWQVLKQLSKSDHKLLRYMSKGILETL